MIRFGCLMSVLWLAIFGLPQHAFGFQSLSSDNPVWAKNFRLKEVISLPQKPEFGVIYPDKMMFWDDSTLVFLAEGNRMGLHIYHIRQKRHELLKPQVLIPGITTSVLQFEINRRGELVLLSRNFDVVKIDRNKKVLAFDLGGQKAGTQGLTLLENGNLVGLFGPRESKRRTTTYRFDVFDREFDFIRTLEVKPTTSFWKYGRLSGRWAGPKEVGSGLLAVPTLTSTTIEIFDTSTGKKVSQTNFRPPFFRGFDTTKVSAVIQPDGSFDQFEQYQTSLEEASKHWTQPRILGKLGKNGEIFLVEYKKKDDLETGLVHQDGGKVLARNSWFELFRKDGNRVFENEVLIKQDPQRHYHSTNPFRGIFESRTFNNSVFTLVHKQSDKISNFKPANPDIEVWEYIGKE